MIHREFTFNNPHRFIRNEQPKGALGVAHREDPLVPADGFTEQMIDSMDETLRNVSTKSVILAPFNSSISESSRVDLAAEVAELMKKKNKMISFAARCRD